MGGRLVCTVVAIGLLTACGRSSGPPGKYPASPTAETSPRTVEASSAPASAGCLNGWTTPRGGTPERQRPLDLIRMALGVEGTFLVDAMRYFEGPERPGTEPARSVKRWYAKVRLSSDESVRGRFIVEDRGVGAGVVAVAPWTTNGFESGDWRGFDGEGQVKSYPGIPGKWPSMSYDFVTGAEGPGPGLPAEAAGCLAGT